MQTTLSPKIVLFAVSIGTFLVFLDLTIVNLVLPSIRNEFHPSFLGIQILLVSYATSMAAILPISGFLCDRLSAPRLFKYGLFLFFIASICCFVSPSMMMLNIGRTLQGIGSGLMLAAGLPTVSQAFTGADRNKAIGIWGTVTGLSIPAGPILGGLVGEYISWRRLFQSIFPYVSAPY